MLIIRGIIIKYYSKYMSYQEVAMNLKSSFPLVALIIISVAVSLVFVSCPNEMDFPRYGSLSISPWDQDSRTIQPDPAEIGIVSYTLNGIYSDNTTTFDEVNSSETILVVEKLLVGEWTITLDGLNDSGDVVASKTQVVTIREMQNTSVNAYLELLTGNGDVSITINWPSSVSSFTQIRGTVIPSVEGKDEFTVASSSATTSEGLDSIVQTIEDLPTGSYQLIIEFLDEEYNGVGLFYQEAMNIYKGMTSHKTYDVPEVFFPIETPVISIDDDYLVSISCATESVTIYYTTDGKEPTTSSEVYSDSFTIHQNCTVKAFAIREDRLTSAVAEESLEVKAALPTFSVVAGTYETPQNVEITTSTSGATIYYTLDGTTPTASSSEYTEALSLSETTIIKAIAVKDNMENSSVSEITYTIYLYDPVSAPYFTPVGGVFEGLKSVEINSTTAGTTIYFTINGDEPDRSSTEYTEAIDITENTIVKAYAIKSGAPDSPTSSAEYFIKPFNPTSSVASGTYSTTQTIELESATEGTTIYYTRDGTDPTNDSAQYINPFTVTTTTTIKVIAIKDNLNDSSISTYEYYIGGTSGITPINPANYSVTLQLPEGWEEGTLVIGVGDTVTTVVTPEPEEGEVTYKWYLDGLVAINNNDEEASISNTLEFGMSLDEIWLESGPHILTVEITAGDMKFSDHKVIVASTTGTIGIIDSYEVGDVGPTGGYIFYVDENNDFLNWNYLEAAPTDLGSYKFGYFFNSYLGYHELVGTATEIGTGEANTTALVRAMGSAAYTSSSSNSSNTTADYAARVCDTYEAEGYYDWFLPSKKELDLMYKNLKNRGLGGFSDDFYWSSSESHPYYASRQHFGSGHQSDTDDRSYAFRVRPVRAF